MGILAIAEDLPTDLDAIKAGLPPNHPFSEVKEFVDEASLVTYIQSLEKVQQKDLPCLFVLDLNIGTQDSGERALKAIRGSGKLRHIPILIASVTDRKKTIKKLYSEGLNSFVVKGDPSQISSAFAEIFSYWGKVVKMPCDQN